VFKSGAFFFNLCQVLGDVIESIAGAIFVDSGYKKEIVFKSIRPLLEPLVTPETARRHPISVLQELCQKNQYKMEVQSPVSDNDGTLVTIKVKANRITYQHTAKASNKDKARKVASKELLKQLKVTESMLSMNRRRFLFTLLSAVFLFCCFVDEIIFRVLCK